MTAGPMVVGMGMGLGLGLGLIPVCPGMVQRMVERNVHVLVVLLLLLLSRLV